MKSMIAAAALLCASALALGAAHAADTQVERGKYLVGSIGCAEIMRRNLSPAE